MWYCTFNIHQNWVLTHSYHSKVMCCIFIHEKKSLSTNDNRIETLKMIYFASMFNEEGDDWYISKIIADKLNPIRYNINTVNLLLLVFVNCRASFVYNFTFKISFLNYKANCYHFGVKSSMVINLKLCNSWLYHPHGVIGGAKYAKKDTFSKTFSIPTHARKTLNAWLLCHYIKLLQFKFSTSRHL